MGGTDTEISIHALAKRATVKFVASNFVPRISIHALAKRATLILIVSPTLTVDFNPRPRKEGDFYKCDKL